MAAVAAVQEEIGSKGALTTAFSLEPDLAVAVDVTHATDAPGVEEKELGRHPLGSGPVIGRGSTLSPQIFELLVRDRRADRHPVHDRGVGSRDLDGRRRDPDLARRHPRRAGLDPAALHALAGGDGRPGRRRGGGRADRGLREALGPELDLSR